jgi:hypothetical protein
LTDLRGEGEKAVADALEELKDDRWLEDVSEGLTIASRR